MVNNAAMMIHIMDGQMNMAVIIGIQLLIISATLIVQSREVLHLYQTPNILEHYDIDLELINCILVMESYRYWNILKIDMV